MLKTYWERDHEKYDDDYIFVHDILEDDFGHKYLLAETINKNNFVLTGNKKIYVLEKDYSRGIISKQDYYAITIDKSRYAYLDDYEEKLQIIDTSWGYGPYGM